VRNVEVGLVQQGGGTQREVGAAPPQFPLGNIVELAIEGGEQLARRRSIACIRGLDELGDRRVHRFLPLGRSGRESRWRGTTCGWSERPSKRPLTTVTALNVERSRVIEYLILLTSDSEPGQKWFPLTSDIGIHRATPTRRLGDPPETKAAGHRS